MLEMIGKKIFGGIAIGRIKFYSKETSHVVRTEVDDAEAEIARYEAAKRTAVRQLEELYTKASVEVGAAYAEIFHVHAMMLEDDDYSGSVHNMIVVDGYEGKFLIDPETPVLESYLEKKKADDEQKKLLRELKGKENVTRSGQRIDLYANIGSLDDLGSVLENDAGAYGNLAILYPMITSVNEVKKIRDISRSVREELTAEGIAVGEVEEGIMIETPAASPDSYGLGKRPQGWYPGGHLW